MDETKIIAWMSEHGHPGYAKAIEILEIRIARLQQEIEEVKHAALDRYEDWRSDPLP